MTDQNPISRPEGGDSQPQRRRPRYSDYYRRLRRDPRFYIDADANGDEPWEDDDLESRYWVEDSTSYDTLEEEPEPYWTPERIFLTVLIILTLIAFLVYTFSGLFVDPTPAVPPTRVPIPRV